MVAGVFSPETPQYGIAVTVEVDWFIAFGVVTAAPGTDRFAATVVVRH